MHESFDPYRKWLGIRSPERPLNHYQLLGLEAFEDDLETISNAAEQRMVFVRTLALSQYADLTQRVLNELAAAKVSLLNPDKKIAYDKQLRAREAAAPPPPVATPQRPPVSPHRPMVSPPPASARLPPPARIAPTRIAPPGIAPPRPAADFDPAPLPRLPDLPPWSGAPAVRHRPSSIAARRTRGRNAPMGLWGFAAFGGLLAVIVLVGVITVVTALRKQGGGEVVKIDPSQTDVQPPAPEPKPPPTPEPPKTQPQPPQNLAPSAEIVSVEPEAPEAGGSLTVHLTGRDPEDDAMGFEYRTGANQPWRIAADGRVLLAKLEPGQLTLEVRARDSGGRISATVTRIVTVKPSVPPLAMALFTADQAKRQQEAWANHLECKIEESNSIGMKLILIPPGEFQMGSPPSEVWRQGNELQHRVRITKPFYLGVYEVTQKEYQNVMGNNPSHFSPAGAGKDQVRGLDTNQFPVENVSWDDTNEFCRKLSALAAEQAAGRVYRLPTEAEWEYACRAGTTTPFHFGAQCNGAEANCQGQAPYGTDVKGPLLGRTAKVGSYAPNPFGLYDMAGNTWEWCSDWYDADYYGRSPPDDPQGPAASGSFRVIRSGGWGHDPVRCRCAFRGMDERARHLADIGFRVVLALVPSNRASETTSDAASAGGGDSSAIEQGDVDVEPSVAPTRVGPYSSGLAGRGDEMRQQLAASRGATAGSESAVGKALKWLAEHQFPDSGWSFDHRGAPKCGNRCGGPGTLKDARLAATGLALMPFLGQGQTHKRGKYKDAVRGGLLFLCKNMKVTANGGDMTGGGGAMYGHGICSIALCEAYAMTLDRFLMDPAQAALNFIIYAQDPAGGGWRYSPRTAGDTSVVGWQIMALKSGHLGNLQVPQGTVKGAEKFLDFVQTDDGAAYGYDRPGGGAATNAVGLLCRMYMGWPHEDPRLERGVKWLATTGSQPGNMYFNYYASQVLCQYEGPLWEDQWNPKMRDMLVESQSTADGHENGSWVFKGDPGSDPGGRLYSTAMAAMTLEVYYRYMPLYSK